MSTSIVEGDHKCDENGVALARIGLVSILIFNTPERRKQIGRLLATGPEGMTRIAMAPDDVDEKAIRDALALARGLFPLPTDPVQESGEVPPRDGKRLDRRALETIASVESGLKWLAVENELRPGESFVCWDVRPDKTVPIPASDHGYERTNYIANWSVLPYNVPHALAQALVDVWNVGTVMTRKR